MGSFEAWAYTNRKKVSHAEILRVQMQGERGLNSPKHGEFKHKRNSEETGEGKNQECRPRRVLNVK